MTGNPLVAGAVDTATPFSGSGLLESGVMLKDAIGNGSWLEGGLATLSLGMDAFAAAIDPIGTLISWGVGWLLDHFEPLKGWLNKLTGDAGAVIGGAQTWTNISAQLQGCAEAIKQSLATTLASAESLAVDAYRANMDAAAEHVGMIGGLADGISKGLQFASTIVQVVHDITRDVMAQIVGTLASAIIEMICTLGLATPHVVSSVSTKVATMSSKVKKSVDAIVRAFDKLKGLFRQVDDLLKNLKGKFDDLFRGAGKSGTPTKSATKSADDAASAATGAKTNPSATSKPKTDVTDCGDPVDPSTGHVFLDRVDVELPGALPLVLERRFVSSYTLGRSFGKRWASTLDAHVEVNSDSIALVRDDGSILLYPPLGVGDTALPIAGRGRWLLTRDDADRLRATDPVTGMEYRYAGSSRRRWLVEQRDRAGRWIRFERTSRGVCERVVHHGGYEVVVRSDGSRVTALEVDGVPVAQFDYVAGALVSELKPSGGLLRYEVDATDRMTAWIDSTGVRYLYVYDERDRCVRQGLQDAADPVMRYSYRYEPGPVPGGHTTLVTDADGATEMFVIDERTRIVGHIDATGGQSTSTFDEWDREVSTTDANGATTRYEYDDASRLVGIIDPLGATTRIEFDASGMPVRVIDPLGGVLTQSFDELGRLVEATDPTGSTYRWAYTDDAVQVTDPTGRTSVTHIDRAGLPIGLTDPAGGRATLQRDPFGRVIAWTDQLGATTGYSWSTEGQLLVRQDPHGGTDVFVYDGEGNLVESTDASGRVTRATYGAFDVCTSQTKPDGSVLAFGYDNARRLTSITNENGATWRYERDGAGRVVRETDYDGRATDYVYDLAGRLVQATDAAGHLTHYTYDAAGNITSRDAGGATTTYRWDAAGRLVEASNPDVTVVRSLDAIGMLDSETVTSTAAGARPLTMSWTRDAAGRLTSRTTPMGIATRLTLDDAGRAIELALAGQRIGREFDAVGRVIRADFTGGSVQSRFDAIGRLDRRSSEAGSAWAVDYAYAPTDELIAEVDSRRGRRDFTLDPVGRVTAIAGASSEAYAYDPAGNMTRAAWASSVDGDAQGERSYQGTLLVRAGRDQYTYDKLGRVTSRTRHLLSGGVKRWQFTWNALNQLTSATVPDGTSWTYAYDPFGRRTSKTHLSAQGKATERVTFSWDGPVMVEQSVSTRDEWSVTTWEHDGFVPVAQTTRKGDRSQTAYDAEFALIVTDLTGTPHHLIDANGRTVGAGATTLWGATNETATPLRFQGQYLDAETGLHYNYNRYYDPTTGRYITQDPLGLVPQANPATYPDNPTTHVDPMGLAPCVNLASESRTKHILYGDETGGGHLWPGKPDKTPFPENWSPERIMHEVSDVATDPHLTWVQQSGKAGSMYTKAGNPARFVVIGERGGTRIKVVLEPAGEGIITAYPL